jgi:hypothetical protein
MIVDDFVKTILRSDRVRIVQQGKDIFVGFLASLTSDTRIYCGIKDKEVSLFRAVPEIRHKQWKELGLMKPLEPDETPDFSFSDLEMKLYYTIHITGE